MNIQECYEIIKGDYKDVLNRLGSDSLIAMFLQKFPEDGSYQELVEAMNEGDCKKAFHAAHTLKGVCGNLGIAYLGEVAIEICELLRADDMESAIPLMAEVTARYDSTLKGIKDYTE